MFWVVKLPAAEVRRRARALRVDHKPIETVANETAAENIHRADILASG